MQKTKEMQVRSWLRKILWTRKRQPAPAFLPGESHEQRSLTGYSPWGCKESRDWAARYKWRMQWQVQHNSTNDISLLSSGTAQDYLHSIKLFFSSFNQWPCINQLWCAKKHARFRGTTVTKVQSGGGVRQAGASSSMAGSLGQIYKGRDLSLIHFSL